MDVLKMKNELIFFFLNILHIKLLCLCIKSKVQRFRRIFTGGFRLMSVCVCACGFWKWKFSA